MPAARKLTDRKSKEGGKMRIAIVVSEYNFDVTSPMLEQAKQHAQFLGERS